MTVVRARPNTSEWFTEANPLLKIAEVGLELDTGKFKMGDGITYWNDLSYVGDNGGSGAVYQQAVVQITDAQIKALRATDVEIIDPPGAGKAILVESFDVVLDASNGAYVNASGAELDLGFEDYWVDLNGNGLDATTDTLQEATGVVSSAAVSQFFYEGLTSSGYFDLTQIEDKAFCVGNIGDVEWTGGGAGNTISVRVVYRIVDTVPFTE